jgi:hypothetical protein
MFLNKLRLRVLLFFVLFFLFFAFEQNIVISQECVELLSQPWRLEGENGASEQYQGIPENALQGKDRLQITYNLHGLSALSNDASAIIFDQNGWKFVSLSNYGQNGLDGTQTVEIPLSHFGGLNPNASVGTLHTRFWYSSHFVVDIFSIKACGNPPPPPTTAPTSTPIPTETPLPTTPPTNTSLPPTTTNTPIPSLTSTNTAAAPVITVPSSGVELLPQPWYLSGNNGDAQQYQGIAPNVLQGKDTLRVTYNLNGLMALGGDASAIIFDQNGWQFVSLSNYGQNGLNGIQTVDIPLAHFTNLNRNVAVGTLHTRFWYGSQFSVVIYSIIAYAAQPPILPPTLTPTNLPTVIPPTSTPIPTVTSTNAATAVPVITIPNGGVELLSQPWYLRGNNGASEQYQGIAPNILQGKDTLRITYNLNGLMALGNDASAIIFDQNGWQFISLSNYGQNGLNGVQTVDIPLADFSGLNRGASVGTLHTRFWYGSAFAVDIYSIIAFTAQSSTLTPLPTNTATQIPVTPTLTFTATSALIPTVFPVLLDCPSGTGPRGIPAGGYNPQKLTQEQRQWLWEKFGHSGTAPVGYGGEPCNPDFGSGDENFKAFVCRRAERGPGGILPGGYDPTTLTQDQRNWLFEQFGHIPPAPVGYGGEGCPVTPVPQCPVGIGPGGIVAGGYTPQNLTQEQRQWLWDRFGHSGTAPVGYGGELCQGNPNPPTIAPTSQSTPLPNTWGIGRIVYLCQGTQIRQGSGLSYTVHTVVPVPNWAVKIIDGPRYADSLTWWNIDRNAAAQDGGGTGWVTESQANCQGSGGVATGTSLPPTPTSVPAQCRAILVNIDQTASNGVVTADMSGLDGCVATLVVQNTRSYWVNMRLSADPGVILEVVDGYFYVSKNILPPGNQLYPIGLPSGQITIRVHFSGSNQHVYVLVDTEYLGEWSQDLRYGQAVSDAISVITGIRIADAFTTVVAQTDFLRMLASLPHLRAAAEALVAPSINLTQFHYEMGLAFSTGELTTIAGKLRELGFSQLQDWLLSKTSIQFQQLVSVSDAIWRNFHTAFSILFTGTTAGTIIIASQ